MIARSSLERFAQAWLCACALLLVEAVAVALLARHELAAGYELGRALSAIVPLGMLVALPVAGIGAIAVSCIEASDRVIARGLLALLCATAQGSVAFASSGGRRLVGAGRPAVVIVALIVGAAAGWFGARALDRAGRWLRDRSRVAFVGCVVVLLAALELANARILPKLYPGFHLGLAVLTVAASALGALASSPGRPNFPLGFLWVPCGAIALVGGLLAPKRLSLYDNLRWIYLEHAPILAYAVRVAAELEPPPPLDDEAAPERQAGERVLDFGGRDVLLVTIDALRADHVGAYGYDRPTTPRLDALAAEGVLFEAAYTPTPHTSYAISSLMTGKYMRPLLLQSLGGDSETIAEALRRYEFHTAAFFPPAVFFVDRERFAAFEQSGLGFEYKKEQFSTAAERVHELRAYLASRSKTERVFAWVHLFEPHEPYQAHAEFAFGDRAIDRYDAEIATADAGLGAIVDAMRAVRPNAIVIVSADHGEEFGEHGGRYHGTSVYDEQVRVPLVVHAPGLLKPARVAAPVGLVDVLPTVLNGVGIPISPRIRGRDLAPLLTGRAADDGFAFSETDEQTLLARGAFRLLCARRVGACRLFDVAQDPRQQRDAAAAHAEPFERLRGDLRRFIASLGRFESAESGWPHALRRGIAGDVEAAADVASLLTDADVRYRRKAAETLFELATVGPTKDGNGVDRPFADEVAEPLRRALGNDEDETVRRWSALGLSRLGQGAPLAYDLVRSAERDWQRLAALALADGGDRRGEPILIEWWRAAYPEQGEAEEPLSFERARQVALAFAKLRTKSAVIPLTRALGDVRLRAWVARALGAIGEVAARPALAQALEVESYHDARLAIAEALVSLGARAELVAPLAHFLGGPDPLAQGLSLATRAKVLGWIGGPNDDELERLRRFATSGVMVGVVVPDGGNGTGLRVVVRARTRDGRDGEVRVGLRTGRAVEDRTRRVPREAPKLDPASTIKLAVRGRDLAEVFEALPRAITVKPREAADFVIYATQNVELDALAVVPQSDEGPVPVALRSGNKNKPKE